MDLYYLALPSALALAIKGWLFFYARRLLVYENRDLGLFLLALFCLNLFELVSFSFVDKLDQAIIPLLLYYIALVFTMFTFLNLCAQLSGYKQFYQRRVHG